MSPTLNLSQFRVMLTQNRLTLGPLWEEKMAARVAGTGGLRGRPGDERVPERLILRTGEGKADYRLAR